MQIGVAASATARPYTTAAASLTGTNWIGGPAWDAVWLLSGVPIAVVFLLASLWLSPYRIVFWATVILANAHFLSPLVLTWSNKELRERALAAPRKYLMLPLLLLTSCLVVGLVAPSLPITDLNFSSVQITRDNYRNPLTALLAVYVLWNAYHFGKQNFGVLSLYRVRSGQDRKQRVWDNRFCLTMIFAATFLPFLPSLLKLLMADALIHDHTFLSWAILVNAYGDGVLKIGAIILFAASLAVMLPRERHLPRILFIIATALAPVLTVWWDYLSTMIHVSALASHSVVWSWAQRLPFWPGLWTFALLAINHWLVAIGLSSRIFSRRSSWAQASSLVVAVKTSAFFILPLLAAGVAVYALLFIGIPHIAHLYTLNESQMRVMIEHLIGLAITLRIGLGFVHFLYDRWLYKLSDPAASAMIGGDIFLPRHGPAHLANLD